MKRIFAFLVALAVSAGVTACGDKGSGGGAGGGGGVVGTWTMDQAKFMDLAMAEGKKLFAALPEAQRKEAEDMMRKKVAGMKMEFKVAADKTFTGVSQESAEAKSENVAGTWEETGGKYVFTTKTKDGQPATGEDAKAVAGRMVGNQLVISMPDGPEMSFNRK